MCYSCRHWLKTAISLTLVLGITWLVGLLVFRQELLFVAYVVTIFIAGQGVLLFVILVPCSRQVRLFRYIVVGCDIYSIECR